MISDVAPVAGMHANATGSSQLVGSPDLTAAPAGPLVSFWRWLGRGGRPSEPETVASVGHDRRPPTGARNLKKQ